MQEAAGKLLFVLADVVRSKAALGGGQVDQFRVVESDAQLFRQHFPDGMAAGTVFPVNGNDQRGVRSISGRLCQRRKLACCSGARQPFQEPVRPEDVSVEKTDDHSHQDGGHHEDGGRVARREGVHIQFVADQVEAVGLEHAGGPHDVEVAFAALAEHDGQRRGQKCRCEQAPC